jgi:ammonia channel protein AmtB
VITLWVAFWAGAFFFGFNACGMLRIDEVHEVQGLDLTECGGTAYYLGVAQVDKTEVCVEVQSNLI